MSLEEVLEVLFGGLSAVPVVDREVITLQVVVVLLSLGLSITQ